MKFSPHVIQEVEINTRPVDAAYQQALYINSHRGIYTPPRSHKESWCKEVMEMPCALFYISFMNVYFNIQSNR